ncbi:Nuclear anchorage protein 1 [Toxocara canis]|uniref:Nuclear anchorage protein 1 n=1 Tax=Toxocara canis TaxID=6265 RepID=A0A0B2VZW1_TOXCA|nr:Nuclear anchorage protein 1 [Toxocara canis]
MAGHQQEHHHFTSAYLHPVSDEHDTAQKNTFTRWINYHLETHSSSSQVDDLFEDLKDGVLLCHLIEVLTGEALPVNKAKVSKRVHHISNLTTALSALRRRGLDLVNNNPSDIADGNPRIVLGLIWQIILHFQIETNVQLLREWGFELEGNSPSTSGAASSGSSPTGKLPQRLRVGRLKAPVEKVVLRWVNAHLSEAYNISVSDMDRSWRDGVAFNALIHRAKPELVDMDQVRRAEPKDNLEQAFRLAHDYLQIRPLLEVKDMLGDKPDKRSVITYVSQFIRSPSLVCPIAAGPMLDDRSLLLWIESTLFTLRNASAAPTLDQYQAFRLAHDYLQIRPLLEVKDMLGDKPDKRSVITYVSQFIRSPSLVCPIAAGPMLDDRSLLLWIESTLFTLRNASAAPTLDQYQTHLALRKEYFDRRHAYLSLRENSNTLPRDEWNRIENGWKKIGELLTEQSHGLESELPASLSFLAQWLCTAEEIIRRPIELRVDDAQQTLSRISETIEQHRTCFVDYPSRLERFQSVYLSRRADNREIAGEFLEPLKTRLDAVSHEAPRRLQHLHHIQSYYMILAYIESLNQKMELWKSGNSASLVQRWIKEYKVESETAPEKKLRRLIAHLKEVTSEGESYERSLKQCEESSAEVIERFAEMRHYLDSLLSNWREFESCYTKVEEKVSRSERQKRNLMDADASELLRRAERARDAIARMASANGRETANTRLADLRRRITALSRYSVGGRLVVDVQMSGAWSGTSPTEKIPQVASVPTRVASSGQPAASSRLQAWIEEAQRKLAGTVANLLQLDDLMQQISECQKGAQLVESERMALLKMRSSSEENIAEYRKMRKAVQSRAESIKIVRPLFSAFEKHCSNVQKWINADKRDQSEYEQKCDALNNMKFLVESLSRDEYTTWINTSHMSATLAELRKNFENCVKADKEQSKRFDAEEEVAALLAEKVKLIKKQEESWSDYEQTQRNVLAIDRKLQTYAAFREKRNELNAIWIRKQRAAEDLKAIITECAALEKQAQNEKRTVALASLADQLDARIGQCTALTETSLFRLRDHCLERLTVFRRSIDRSLEGAELRVKELSLVGEADLQVAAKVLKDIEQEAQHLSESERERLKRAVEEASEVIQLKMDLFARLQRFYETLLAIKNENASWNSVGSAQVPAVRSRLDELLSCVEAELTPEANALCTQIESVQASFFQLECDRVKEKLRLLMMQLKKLADLMAKRKVFLCKFEEFQEFVKNAEENLLTCIRDASDGKQIDMQRITNEMNCVFDKLNVLGDELATCQVGANMTITDMAITDAVNRIRNLPLSAFEERPAGFSDQFQRFLDTASELQNCFVVDIEQCDTAENLLSFILKLQEDEKEETRLMESLEKLADDLLDAEKERAAEVVVRLRDIVPERSERRRLIIEESVGRLATQLKQQQDEIGSTFGKEFAEGNLPAVEEIEINRWNPWKQQLEKVKPLMNENERCRRQSYEMEEKASGMDERISKFKDMIARKKRRQEKLVTKLTTFHHWLDLIDADIALIESWPSEDEAAIREALLTIRNMCLTQQRLFKKLKKAELPSPHSIEAESCCERFRVLFEKTSHWDIPDVSHLQPAVISHLPSTSMQSQLSLSSLSSSGAEEEAEEETRLVAREGAHEQFVVSTASNNLVERMSVTEDLVGKRQLFPDIDAELNIIAELFSNINADYARSLKPLFEAEDDLKTLQSLQARRYLLENECENFSRKLDGDDLAIVRAFISQARSLKEPIEDFMGALRNEIDDELAIRANYESIMNELDQLNDDVNRRARTAVSDMRQQLENVEMQLDLLRFQCLQSRKYVENSIEETSPTSSPGSSRRKRIILMVSRTVTTIVQVVEDELRKSPSLREKELLEFRTKLEAVNASIEEGHEEGNIDVLIASARKLHESLKRLLSCDFSKQPKDELESSLATAREGRVQLEGILRALQRELSPPTDISAYTENIVTLITSILALENEVTEQLRARSGETVEVFEEPTGSEAGDQYEAANEVVAVLRRLLEEEENMLKDKSSSADAMEEIIKKAEMILPESARLQSLVPAHPFYEDLRVLSAQLELINRRLIDRFNTWRTFKSECQLASDLVDKVRADITDAEQKKGQSFDEIASIVEKLQNIEKELLHLDGSTMARIKELDEMLEPLEHAHQQARLLHAQIEQTKQRLKEAINDKNREKENVEHVLKQIAELDTSLLKGEEALANEEELKLIDEQDANPTTAHRRQPTS